MMLSTTFCSFSIICSNLIRWLTIFLFSSASFSSFVHAAERTIQTNPNKPVNRKQTRSSRSVNLLRSILSSFRAKITYTSRSVSYDPNKTHPLTNTMTSPQPVSQPKPPIPKYLQFAFGGTAGMNHQPKNHIARKPETIHLIMLSPTHFSHP